MNNNKEQDDRLEEYSNIAFEVKKANGKKKDYYIVIRHDRAVHCVARVYAIGVAFYEADHIRFQEHLKKAAYEPDTFIHTLGTDAKKDDEYTGRVYLPSHIDAYEHHRVVRDVTGFIL